MPSSQLENFGQTLATKQCILLLLSQSVEFNSLSHDHDFGEVALDAMMSHSALHQLERLPTPPQHTSPSLSK